MNDLVGDNIVAVRDLCDRVEELREQQEESEDYEGVLGAAQGLDEDEKEELAMLEGVLAEMRGYGDAGCRWEGNYYPGQLIARDYFVEYAKLWAYDNGFKGEVWPATCINWDEAAAELEEGFSSVDFDGTEYLYLY